jgi:hypothetical protein
MESAMYGKQLVEVISREGDGDDAEVKIKTPFGTTLTVKASQLHNASEEKPWPSR